MQIFITESELKYQHVKNILLEMPDNLDEDSKAAVASGSELTASKVNIHINLSPLTYLNENDIESNIQFKLKFQTK